MPINRQLRLHWIEGASTVKTLVGAVAKKFQFQLSWWLWWCSWERECERGREQPDWCRQELCLSCLETFSINARVLQKSELLHCLASIVKWNASLWSEYTWALSLAPIKGNIAQPCLSEVKYKSDCTAVYCQASCLLWNAIVLQCKCRADSTIARLDSTDGCLSTTHCSWAQMLVEKKWWKSKWWDAEIQNRCTAQSNWKVTLAHI